MAASLALAVAGGMPALQRPENLIAVNAERLLGDADADSTVADYLANGAPELAAAYLELSETAIAIDRDPGLTSDQRAALLVTEVAEPVHALAHEGRDLPGAPPALLEVHEAALRALAVAEQKYRTFAEGYRLQDCALFDRGRNLQADEELWWRTWNERAEQLAEQIG